MHSPDPVRWQSGRMRRSRKPLNLYGFREFESHPHRQLSRTTPHRLEGFSFLVLAEFDSCNCSNGGWKDIRNSPACQTASPITSRSSLRCSDPDCSRNKSAPITVEAY